MTETPGSPLAGPIRLLLLVALIAGSAHPVRAQYNHRVIAYAGQEAAGAPGERFVHLYTYQAFLSNSGDVLFRGSTGTLGNIRMGFWARSGGTTRLIMRDGDQAPDLPPGVILDTRSNAFDLQGAIDASGRIVVFTGLAGPGIVDTPPNNAAAFVAQNGALRLLVQGGRVIRTAFPIIGGNDEVALISDLRAVDNLAGVYQTPPFNAGSLALHATRLHFETPDRSYEFPGVHLARTGPIAGVESELLFAFPQWSRPVPMPELPALELSGVYAPVLNPAGQVAVGAHGRNEETRETHFALYRSRLSVTDSTQGPLELLASSLNSRSFITDPFRRLTINARGTVAFLGELAPSAAGVGVYRVSGPGSVSAVVRIGDPAPGVGAAFSDIRDFVLLDDDRAALLAVTSDGRSGVWIERDGSLALVVREGDPAPGTEEGTVFESFRSMAVNNRGEVAVAASLAGPAVRPFDNDHGIWIHDGRAVARVARPGDSLEVNGLRFRIGQVEMRRNEGAAQASGASGPSSAGRPTHFNDQGELIFGVFLDGDHSHTGDPNLSDYALVVASASLLVNHAGDAPDRDPGDGTCDTGGPPVRDRPECTLRAAILEANAREGEDRIEFDIRPTGGEGVPTIAPGSALPPITDPVVLDGTTQPGGLVELSGEKLPELRDHAGLRITGGGSTVRGLVINRFDTGLVLKEKGENVVRGNRIGTDPHGATAPGNRLRGIEIDGSPVNVIGGLDAADRNVVSGNRTAGIEIRGKAATGNLVQGNYIGTDAEGTKAFGNGFAQECRFETRLYSAPAGNIVISGASGNRIGGSEPGARNVISGSSGIGVYIRSEPERDPAFENTVQGNYIGTDRDGARPLGNAVGVCIHNSSRNRIGGIGAAARNVISGNRKSGVIIVATPESYSLQEATGNVVQGNYIGTDRDGARPLGNGADLDPFGFRNAASSGVFIQNAGGNLVGGTEPEAGNVISANVRGVKIEQPLLGETDPARPVAGNRVAGNRIGTDAWGAVTDPDGVPGSGDELGNRFNGVEISDGFRNVVGGRRGREGNVIAGSLNGVLLVGRGSNRVQGNAIGTDAAGERALPNRVGIFVKNESDDLIGGDAEAGNLIAHQTDAGIHMEGAATGVGLNGDRYGGASRNSITANEIRENAVGIRLLYFTFDNTVSGNRIESNRRGYEETLNYEAERYRKPNRFEGNLVSENTGGSSGIHLYGAAPFIQGNAILADGGDGITLEDGADPVIRNNNISGNRGFGLRNADPSRTVDARGNWWGDASGPGGAGPGTGDAASTGADFSGWHTRMVSLVVSASEDTLYLTPGASDTAFVYLQDWQRPTSGVNLTLADEQGWMQGPASLALTLDDRLGARAALPLAVPGGASTTATSRVVITVTAQDDPGVTATDSFMVMTYRRTLARIEVLPDTVRLAPGDTVLFAASGRDQFGNDMGVTASWSATGGAVTAEGLYAAGPEPGRYAVTAADASGQVRGSAVVEIAARVGTEREETLPATFALHQSYPNPFNPRAAIPYDVPAPARVVLKVYDLLGREVTTLVDADQGPGRYTAAFDASGLPSGVYFYEIRMGGFRDVRKMVLAR